MQTALRDAVRGALESSESEASTVLDGGFALLRRLEATAAMASRVVDAAAMPPPPPSAALRMLTPLSTASAATQLSSGSVLVAHPLFRRDVVLLLSAYDGGSGFCMGVVLNQPTAARVGATPLLGGRGQTVGPQSRARAVKRPTTDDEAAGTPAAGGPSVREMLKAVARGDESIASRFPTGDSTSSSGASREEWTTGNRKLTDELATRRHTRDKDLSVFAEHVIHNGGPEGGANVTMIHTHSSIPGCVAVHNSPSPLYYGGDLSIAAEMVRQGEAKAEDFVFYKGRVDWRPGELQGELEFGEWAALKASSDAAADAVDVEPIPATIARAGGSSAPDAVAALANADARRRYRHAAWSAVVGAAATAEEDAGESGGTSGSSELRAWLALRPFEGNEEEELRVISASGAAALDLKT